MTNTKPTWEEFEKELDEWLKSDEHSEYCSAYYEGGSCCLDKQVESHWENPPNSRKFIKAFILKVEQEAYERGQQDCAELNMKMYGTGFIKKKFGNVFKKLSKED